MSMEFEKVMSNWNNAFVFIWYTLCYEEQMLSSFTQNNVLFELNCDILWYRIQLAYKKAGLLVRKSANL